MVHDGSPDLTRQGDEARVAPAPGGLPLVAGARSDLLRCAAWAIKDLDRTAVPAV